MSPHTSSIVRLYYFFRSFEIGENIQSCIKIVRLEPSSIQCFDYLTPFRHVFFI